MPTRYKSGVAETAVIEARGLVKRYGDVEAVRGLDLTVAAGETFGFLGPNGAGKSTTIKILCTLALPSAGHASVAGFDVVRERAAVRRNIGLVFQDTTLDQYLSAERNLRFHGELYGVPRPVIAERSKQVLEMVGLWDRRKARVSTFSGGMKRRLEIARGLLHSPRVLFLDEPTVGLDPQTRASIWNYLEELRRREAITIFLTTHYMDEAEHCDRIAIVNEGQIIALETPDALKASVGTDRVQIATADDDAAIAALARALRDYRRASRWPRHVPRRRRRAVRSAPVRRAARADPLGQRVPSDARRRLPLVYGHDDPGRRSLGGRLDARVRAGPRMSEIGAGSALPVAAVRVAPPGLRSDMRAARVVWQRELIRFGQDRIRIVAALVQPVLFLFVLGTGLQSLTSASTGGTSLRTFMFPGVLATSVLFTAMFSAISIVWDREFGFLREMLVAPVRRGSILVGKCLGGATVATLQGMLVLVLAPLVGVPYNAEMIVELIVVMFLLAFALTAFGLVIAARIANIQTVMGVMQVLLFPLAFLSGALYPIDDLPTWMSVLVRLNPITYAVHVSRNIVFSHIDATPAARAALNPPLMWGDWVVPNGVSIALVAGIGAGLLGLAMVQFARVE